MFKHYLSTALRHFRGQKLITAINLASLALGLACFLGAYAAVRYIDSSDREFANSDRAYAVTQRIYSPQRGFDTGRNAYTAAAVAKYLRKELPALEAVARGDHLGEVDVVAGARKARFMSMAVDADFLKIFPFRIVQGSPQHALSEPRSIVLTASSAARLFGAAAPLGKTIRFRNALDLKVTAVMSDIAEPSQFSRAPMNSTPVDLLVSWDVAQELEYLTSGQRPEEQPEVLQWARISGPTYVLLPQSGAVSAATLENTLSGFSKYVPEQRRKLANFEFGSIAASAVWKSSLNAALFHGSDVSITWLLQVLGALVLATACCNYANLAASSATAKLKETGMRRVLGARATQVAVHGFVEAALLALVALLLAVGLLMLIAPPVRSVAGIDLFPMLRGSFYIWTCALAALGAATLLAGSYPAFVLAGIGPAGAMRQKRRARSSIMARLLAGAQFACCSLLLIVVMVILAQGRELRDKGLGASASQTLVIANNLGESKVEFEMLRDRLLRIPGVAAVSAVDQLPWGFNGNTGAIVRTLDASSSFVSPFFHTVAADFLPTLGMRLLAGRAFDTARGEDFFDAPFPAGLSKVDPQRIYSVVIDMQLARQLGWNSAAEAVDQVAYIPGRQVGLTDVAVRVIGVVADKPLRFIGAGTTTNLFLASNKVGGYPLVSMSGTDIGSTLKSIESVWNDLSPQTSLQRRFLDQQFELNYRIFERIGRVIGALTAIALLISLMGLFGMAVFIASRRRHEIGVRKTLGAGVRQILAMLLRDFSKPVVAANLAVWPLGYLAANAYLAMFTQRIALTPMPFVTSLVLTLLAAWLAVGGQAWRAARLRPSAVLRYE